MEPAASGMSAPQKRNWDAALDYVRNLRDENAERDGREDNNGAGEQASSRIAARQWPAPMGPEAFRGAAGDFVALLEPHTESDTAALLIQFLTGMGNMLGRSIYRVADGAAHRLNLFVVLVGDTSHGRKGSAWAQVVRLLRLVDEDWAREHIHGGLSSGEGLIWAVRDPIERREPLKERGRFTGEYQTIEADPGVADKRLLVVEPEYVSVLRVCERERNTLSSTIRYAWDSGDLRTMTKNSPAKATGAHISVIGHITRDELLRGLDSTDAANGFANRFLWLCVKRSKQLPFGGSLNDGDFGRLVATLREVAQWCRQPRELDFSAEARDAWCQVYGNLSGGRPGLLGAILGRAEAQVLRLACLYAALDRSSLIELQHLESALAVWEYCERSADYIFADRLGDPDADAILSALRSSPQGLTRTQIRDLFARHLNANRIERALCSLLKQNLAAPETTPSGGRPVETWRALEATNATKETKAPRPEPESEV